MIKNCTNCRADYWARWRNEPVTLCRECRTDVVLCMACSALVRPPADAHQLTLWPLLFMRALVVRLEVDCEPHWSHGRSATQAEKRKSPYH